jgi:hypothetical protein
MRTEVDCVDTRQQTSTDLGRESHFAAQGVVEQVPTRAGGRAHQIQSITGIRG